MPPKPKDAIKDWKKHAATWREFADLIVSVESILREQHSTGRGKLKKSIPEISSAEPFLSFPVVYLPQRGEAIFIGDTHGDSAATTSILKQERFAERVERGEAVYLVYLGDYADRGKEDVRNIELILNLKQCYPENTFILRGNHEEVAMGQSYGLLGSCIRHFDYDNGQYVFRRLNDLFEKFAAVAVCANGVVALHGGIPVGGVSSLKQLHDDDILEQIRWNDPTDQTDGFVFNHNRGMNYLFGRDVFSKFMKAIGGSVLIRSHEYVAAGYKFMFDGRILSIFSNGGASTESGYRDFILTPKYAKVSLADSIKRWSNKNVIGVRY
ncbi:MAG: metallophosphoesterase family protein [Patescibacteria group bacterium]